MISSQFVCEERNTFKFKSNYIRQEQKDTLTHLELPYVAYIPLYSIKIQQALFLETTRAQALIQFLELCE